MATQPPSFMVQPIDAYVVEQLRELDDAGRKPIEVADPDGGSPLRCCLRISCPEDRLLLASYAPLRRWAAARGVDPAAYDEVGPVFLHPEPCGGYDNAAYPADLLRSPRVFRAYNREGRIACGRLVQADEDRLRCSAHCSPTVQSPWCTPAQSSTAASPSASRAVTKQSAQGCDLRRADTPAGHRAQCRCDFRWLAVIGATVARILQLPWQSLVTAPATDQEQDRLAQMVGQHR
jgi:hypothetical protein